MTWQWDCFDCFGIAMGGSMPNLIPIGSMGIETGSGLAVIPWEL